MAEEELLPGLCDLMIFDEKHPENYELGNRAMAAILLLYYHLAWEGGITHDQTIYSGSLEFDPYLFLDVRLDGCEEIDVSLLMEGAVIHLLCDLNDTMCNQEDDFTHWPSVQKLFSAHREGKLSAIPEAKDLIDHVIQHREAYHYPYFSKILHKIYKKYVLKRMRKHFS